MIIMKQVAKLVIVGPGDKYLLLYRSAHPRFGNDPDLPGGTLEDGELPLATMIREVYEEAGIKIREDTVRHVYAGTDYSASKTHYSLYMTTVKQQPVVTLSWEHSAYDWLDRNEFLVKAKNASDTYMRMVYDVLKD